MLIGIQNPQASQVASYRTWKKAGRQVRKGEKGIRILVPMVVEKPKTDKNGNPVKNRDGKEAKERRLVGFRVGSVFDVSQTDGPPETLPRSPYSGFDGAVPPGLKDDLEDAIRKKGFEVSYADDLGASDGATSPVTMTVKVKKGMTEADTVSTLAHELGHIEAGHLQRFDEYHTGADGARPAMEVEAESISYVLLRANGMNLGEGKAHGSYVYGWGGTKRDTEEVTASAETVSKAVSRLLSQNSWRNTIDAETH